jgi:hypothetical protein
MINADVRTLPPFPGVGRRLADGSEVRNGTLNQREARAQPQDPYKDPWWRVALSCMPIINGIMQVINDSSTRIKCLEAKEKGDSQGLAKALEQRNRHRVYSIIGHAIAVVALIALVAASIFSLPAILPMVIGAAGIGMNAFFIHKNKQHIHQLKTDPTYIQKELHIY